VVLLGGRGKVAPPHLLENNVEAAKTSGGIGKSVIKSRLGTRPYNISSFGILRSATASALLSIPKY